MSTPGDRPAFPSSSEENAMLRAYLAGQALAGLQSHLVFGFLDNDKIAQQAVLIADATLNELAKEGR